ncbi:MAG TPA: hypothetical protein PKV21_04810 [bacterium]|nr:hypothetical protein [bacterium]HOM26810.1 hypothetical protein [bacterium]
MYEREVKKFQKFGQDIWYPVEIERRFYDGKGQICQRDHKIIKKFIPNSEVKDSLFTLKFPKGLLINDGIKGTGVFAK